MGIRGRRLSWRERIEGKRTIRGVLVGLAIGATAWVVIAVVLILVFA
ncbi:hypothetical protein [Williamsia sterculiae]|uniref:Uncharacterized protein n=1 Tax=Williamsia sterculiae TaxID=1344003 RepID=A0A1N7D1U2_9NOCA|nr:hypothetical protein [Williamsia sterculiae]SIR69799.1 hypothetical protein SAMN05445060_0516 [Williamsia sterculiae]